MKGRILNRNHGGIPRNAVFIGRGSKYGNPYKIGRDGSRDEVIALYRDYLLSRLEEGYFTIDEIIALYETDLVCYCHPLPCHGEVIHEFGKCLRDIEGM